MHLIEKIQTTINQLEYDFSNYSTDGFIYHLASRRQRNIVVDGIVMSHHTSGGYIQTRNIDFIFYNNQRNTFMQNHFILHEVGHMVLEHTQHTVIIDNDDLNIIAQQISHHFAFRGHFRIQHPTTIERQSDTQEREAELFVRLINSQRYANNQLDEIKRNSNIPLLPPFIANWNDT